MGATKMFFVFLVLGSVTMLEPVFGATCSNSTTCVHTTYTQTTCNSTTKICNCSDGYVPIRTGCGRKFFKPTLSQAYPYSTEVLVGKNAVLSCVSPDGATVFEWKNEGIVIIGATKSTYTITSASAANVGNFTCKAKLSTTNSDFDSPESEALLMTLINETVTPKSPVVDVYPTELFAGKNATLTCRNLPNGYNISKISFLINDSTVFTSPLTMTSTLSENSVTCNLTDTTLIKTVTSVAQNLSKVVDTISGVKITTTASNNEVYSGTEAITLTCLTTPTPDYVDTSSKQITYVWMINSTAQSGQIAQTYTLQNIEGNFIITCNASYNATTLTSSAITITRNNSYISKLTITASPTIPVFGSLLTLACGKYDNGQYTWKKNNVDIARQYDHTLQLDSLTTSDAGSYVCSVMRSKVTMTSESFTITNGHVITMGSVLVSGLMFLVSRLLF
ncbi:hemicentin-2 [Biomphalaria pfeifferi]|uniref:Hemicentin-2 n=1 Tax=Biomphalaria pfeifferi TaxID=112525 RepID=A0AAD8BTE8_BIOPF|nr:hemicentin-2 [Biomphalaria pfeifferi]